jgi:phosphatidylinositol alpha-1,6-mannosyltransferase
MAILLFRIWYRYRGQQVIVYALTWKLARMARRVARRLGWKLVVFAHGTEITRSFSWHKRRSMLAVFRNADLCLGVSRYTADVLIDAGIDSRHVRVLNNSVDTAMYYPVTKNDEIQAVHALRKEFDSENRVLILTLARVIQRKGQDTVIEALALLRRSNRLPPEGVRYLIAGKGTNNEIRRLQGLAKRLGVQDLVYFSGRVPADAMRAFYNACDLYIMNSRRLREGEDEDVEGFGITFLEAGACGKAVIGGRSGGVPDAVADGSTGFLVDPENIEELANCIARLILDRQLREKMGAESLRRARDEFNSNAIGRRLLEIISTISDDRTSVSRT